MNDDDVSFQHHEHTKEGRAAARQSMGDPSSAAPTAAVGSKRLAQEHLVQVVATRVTNAAAGQFGKCNLPLTGTWFAGHVTGT